MHQRTKILLLFCAAITSFASISLFVSAFALLKDMPSIHNHNQPFCKKGYLQVEGRYLSFNELPKNTLRVFKVAEPFYKHVVVRHLAYEMPQMGHFVWRLRAILLLVWIKKYQEKDLIEFYLNRAYFGKGCSGIDAASKEYFHKELNLLSLEETAQLLAILKSPSGYSITEHPNKNKERADYILNELQKQELQQIPAAK